MNKANKFKYNITISNIEHICGKPVKLKFEARYNKQGELSTPPDEAARRTAAQAASAVGELISAHVIARPADGLIEMFVS